MIHCFRIRGAAIRAALICCLFAAAHTGGLHAQPAPKTINVLMVSDIHFDPFCEPDKVVQELNQATNDYDSWQRILDRAVAPVKKSCSKGRFDTSYALLKSSFDAIRKNANNIAFVTVSGDLLAHNLRDKYGDVFPGYQPSEYAKFAEKTANFVILELNQLFPGVPVYIALGNNDSSCDDYVMQTGDEFLKATAKQITEPIPALEHDDAMTTYTEGGYYSVSLPAPMQNARLLVLEDLYMSAGYKTSCGGTSDVVEELKWLNAQVAHARTHDQSLWVMGHIPTGLDPYNTLRYFTGNCSAITPTPFMKSDDLFDAIAGAGDVIRLALFAHTHMDEIKLLAPDSTGTAKEPVPAKVLPSISPINGNHPTFTIAEIDPVTATLVNYQVFAASASTPTRNWTMEYDYAKSYGESSFSASSVEHLIAAFTADSSAKNDPSKDYVANYEAGKQDPFIDGLVWPKYVCTLDHNSTSGFGACACPNGP